jgi:hypothetical protein
VERLRRDMTISTGSHVDVALGRIPPSLLTPSLHRGPGVYVVTLTNTHPISVNADRPAIADRCIKVTRENCKFGKARDLHVRRGNYIKTFGVENVRFHSLAAVDNPELVEAIVGTTLWQYRIRGTSGRPNEWLAGISPSDVEAAVFAALDSCGLKYLRLGRVEI